MCIPPTSSSAAVSCGPDPAACMCAAQEGPRRCACSTAHASRAEASASTGHAASRKACVAGTRAEGVRCHRGGGAVAAASMCDDQTSRKLPAPAPLAIMVLGVLRPLPNCTAPHSAARGRATRHGTALHCALTLSLARSSMSPPGLARTSAHLPARITRPGQVRRQGGAGGGKRHHATGLWGAGVVFCCLPALAPPCSERRAFGQVPGLLGLPWACCMPCLSLRGTMLCLHVAWGV